MDVDVSLIGFVSCCDGRATIYSYRSVFPPSELSDAVNPSHNRHRSIRLVELKQGSSARCMRCVAVVDWIYYGAEKDAKTCCLVKQP